jgi:hypothetical protein
MGVEIIVSDGTLVDQRLGPPVGSVEQVDRGACGRAETSQPAVLRPRRTPRGCGASCSNADRGATPRTTT